MPRAWHTVTRVANPYNYPRQTFQTYKDGKLSAGTQDGFFMPHDNETGYVAGRARAAGVARDRGGARRAILAAVVMAKDGV
jgi:hypothetical protein